MVLPSGETLPNNQDVEEEQEPSLTYRLDLRRNRIVGKANELDAIKQAVFKMLQTERFVHMIYSADYGGELKGLIGQSQLYVQSELARRIREALLQDDRIVEVEDMQFDFQEERVLVTFTVVSEYGDFSEELEVG